LPVPTGRGTSGTVINISKTGFFIKMNIDSIEIGNKVELCLILDEQSLSLPAEIVWVNTESGQYGKPYGFGGRFKDRHKKLIPVIKLQYLLEQTR
jgi:hypothetical protein